jgi:hypothetical protein
VVELLTALGVRMTFEDPDTMDVHGREFGKGGWPKLLGEVAPCSAGSASAKSHGRVLCVIRVAA